MTTIYRCDDGTEFDNEAEAREHEGRFACTDKAGDTVVIKRDKYGLIVRINETSKPVRVSNEKMPELRDWLNGKMDDDKTVRHGDLVELVCDGWNHGQPYNCIITDEAVTPQDYGAVTYATPYYGNMIKHRIIRIIKRGVL